MAKQVTTDREDVRQVHEALEAVERAFQAASLGHRGNVVTFTWTGAGSVAVSHGLGRAPVGWILLDLSANTTVYRSASFNANTLTLAAGGAATAKVLVF